MVLVDTSVWIDHLRKTTPRLVGLLDNGEVVIHPFVIGELACGNLANRKEVLSLLHSLPAVERVEDDEILFFIEQHSLASRGLGLIDVHLLASSKVSEHPLWTKDKRLAATAEEIGLGFGQPPPA
ncbi:MAG: type II toxin-antitoxin system VapC family toxin [Verrucomicrobia bacterium]|nr:type II toxin-antitoxin system VapC family toxin [Verrucomicrobiota bacterium]